MRQIIGGTFHHIMQPLSWIQMVIMSRQSVIKNKKIEKRKNVSKKIVTIVDVKNYVGQEVTIGAWVANKSGKGKIAFLQLRDGTAFFQGVAFKPNFIEKLSLIHI